jgi:hypothetical protein
MTTTEQYQALFQMFGSRGWQDMLIPLAKERYEGALNSIMNTPGQTDANIHKAAGLLSGYDFILRGVPEWVDDLRTQVEDELSPTGDPEQAPPIM